MEPPKIGGFVDVSPFPSGGGIFRFHIGCGCLRWDANTIANDGEEVLG